MGTTDATKHVKEFYTLPNGQRAMWARAKKAGYEPLLKMDGSLRRTRCPKCRRNALIYSKVGIAYNSTIITCSEGHFTPFDL